MTDGHGWRDCDGEGCPRLVKPGSTRPTPDGKYYCRECREHRIRIQNRTLYGGADNRLRDEDD